MQVLNLIARFRTKHVLSKKCAILDVFRRLADSDPDGGVRALRSTPREDSHAQGTISSSKPGIRERVHERSALDDPSALAGLSYSSTRDPRSKSGGHEKAIRSMGTYERRGTSLSLRNETLPQMTTPKDSHPTEAALLHDLPFTLQGLSTTHLRFTESSTLKLPPTLPLPLVSLLHTLAEPSLLYRNLSAFVQSSDEGLVGQSLRAAIGGELRSYLGLIATLEGEIRRAIMSVGGIEPRGSKGRVGVTLKRCVIWTRDATMALRLMSLMVEQARSR